MNNKVLIVIITLLCVVVLSLSACLVVLIKKDFKFDSLNIQFSKQNNKLIYNREFDTINDLYIKANTSDIYIKHSDNGKVKVKVYSSNKKELSVTNSDKRLSIIFKEKFPHISFGLNTGKIIVYLPSNYDKNIKINADTSDVKINDFESANADIETDTGDVNLTNINNAEIETDTGDVIINKINDTVVETDTGDITIKEVNNYINLKSDTGDIKLNKTLLNKNSKIKTNTGDVTINTINEVWMDTNTDTGDIKIKENYRKSDIELIIKTDTGDIKVGY